MSLGEQSKAGCLMGKLCCSHLLTTIWRAVDTDATKTVLTPDAFISTALFTHQFEMQFELQKQHK